MDFLKNLGFDPVMLGAQIINFLIIFYILKRFLYKPVMDMVKQREVKITDGLKQAEDAKKTLENALFEEKKILTNAQDNAHIIIEDAKLKAIELSKSINENAKTQAEKLILSAHNQIKEDTYLAEKSLAEKTGDLASEILKKSLKGIFSESQQKIIVNKTLRNIKRID